MREYIEIEVIEITKKTALVRIKKQSRRNFVWESKRHPGCRLQADFFPDIHIINERKKLFVFYLRGRTVRRDNTDIWMPRWAYNILIDMIMEYNCISEEIFLLDEKLFKI